LAVEKTFIPPGGDRFGEAGEDVEGGRDENSEGEEKEDKFVFEAERVLAQVLIFG